MSALRSGKTIAFALIAFSLGLLTDGNLGGLIQGNLAAPKAEARVGRPLTPVSGAGVVRRTTRRTIRRSTIYVSTLPAHCVKVSIDGGWYYHCGGTYYQHYSGRYVVVHIH